MRTALYIVGRDEEQKDDYKCTEEDEAVLAPLKWWENATIKPLDAATCVTCQLDEDLLWRCVNAKPDKNGVHMVLVSGSSGAGKSNLLQRFKAHCPCYSTVNVKGLKISQVQITAPTAIAAMNIEGETLHRVLGLGLADDDPNNLFRDISANRGKYAKTWSFLLNTKILIMDEISMVTVEMFNILDFMFRKARKSSLPFGGVILIMFGDFLQLPPVNKNQGPNAARFVFQTEVWNDMNKCRIYLNRNYRQKDKEFIAMLDEVRFGRLSASSEKMLRSRLASANREPVTHTDRVEAMNVYSYKLQVEKNNNAKLAALMKRSGVKLEKFLPKFRVAPRREDQICNPRDADMAKTQYRNNDAMKERFPIHTVELCVGAQVMMRCNFWHAIGICNGTMGIVTSISQESIGVQFIIKEVLQEKPLEVTKHGFRTKFSETVDIVMDQYPLSLAWASTIHKVQGLTLDKLRISGKNCFETGQFYVAISRVRNLEDFILLDYDASCIKADKAAVKFESVCNPDEGSDADDEGDDAQTAESEAECEQGPESHEKRAREEEQQGPIVKCWIPDDFGETSAKKPRIG